MNHWGVNPYSLSTQSHTVLFGWVLSKFHVVFYLGVAAHSKKAQSGIFLAGDAMSLLWNPQGAQLRVRLPLASQ